MPIMPDMAQDDARLSEEVTENVEPCPPAQSSPKTLEPSQNDAEPPGGCEEITSEERSQEGSLTRADEPPRNLSEHLEALMNSGKTAGIIDPIRQPSNGSIEQQEEDPMSPPRKRPHMPNNGPPELHPVIVYDYEGQHISPNFRGRLPSPVSPAVNPFSPWRGAGHQQRGRGGFRGSPRAPWMDRGPRGPPNNFSPRGNKRGSPFRGNNGHSGFRGRGRAGNW